MKAAKTCRDPIAVPRYYKYMFLCIFLMAEMTITGWTLLYMNIEELPLNWFYLNTAVSTPVLAVITLITYCMVVRAITRQYLAREALKESEYRLRGITEVANDGIVLVDTAGTIKFWNPAGEHLFGRSADEVMGMEVEQFIPGFAGSSEECLGRPEPAEGFVPGVNCALEMVGRRADGSEFPIEVSMSCTGTNGGRSIEAIVRDITARRESDQALRESESKYRGLYSSIRDGVVMTDMDGVITECNQAGREILGYEKSEIIGMKCERLMTKRRCLSEQAAGTRTEEGSCPDQHETMFVTSGGEEFPVSVSAWLVEDDDWRSGAWMMFRDMSERRTAEETIRKQADELRNLIDIAAHELRHPATVFKGYSYILLEQGHDLDSETVREALVDIDEAATRMSRLVNELLDTSRIERGKMQLAVNEADPEKLVTRAVEEMRWKDGEVDFMVGREYPGDTLVADSEKVKQVLSILLDNAAKYSPPGGAVEVWCERDRDGVVFHVADQGPGIPPDDRLLIFERFYQVEDVLHHSLPGLGLGLYIARTIVEAHGGWIKTSPRKGCGSLFSFGIPDGDRLRLLEEEIVGL